MSIPRSLKMQALCRFTPAEIEETIKILDKQCGIDLAAPVTEIISPYGFTIAQMVRINRDYAGWWGLPGTISKFTYDDYRNAD